MRQESDRYLVIDPDPIKQFIVSECMRTGQMVFGNINDDDTITVNYADGRTRQGHVDLSGTFHDLEEE
jgi:hypothetical protein